MIRCFLCGLEIPPGRFSWDHYVPKSLAPIEIVNSPFNKFPAHKVINSMKSNLLPCVWEDRKWDLAWYAIQEWNLKTADRNFIRRALVNWETYTLDPCHFCLLSCKRER